MEKTLKAPTRAKLEKQIVNNHTKGFNPVGNVIQKDGMFQITIIKL